MSSPPTMTQEEAETIALRALSFLAKSEELLGKFMAASGISPQELKSRFRNADFLGGILDSLLGDDAVLLEFCNEASLSPETIIRARQALPGGYMVS